MALTIQLNLVEEDQEERQSLKTSILMAVYSTLNSMSNIDDVQQFIYILDYLTVSFIFVVVLRTSGGFVKSFYVLPTFLHIFSQADPFELPQTNETYFQILDIMQEVTQLLLLQANPSNNGDIFMPDHLIATVANVIDLQLLYPNSLSPGESPASVYTVEYLSIVNSVMIIYSLTQVCGERPFTFSTGSLNGSGRKAILLNIPSEQNLSGVSVRLPAIENIAVATREAFQSLVTIDHNPFDWGYTHPITSKVCSLTFYQLDGTKIPVEGLKEPDGMMEFQLPPSSRYTSSELINFNVTLQAGQTLTSSLNLTGDGAALIVLWIPNQNDRPFPELPKATSILVQYGIWPPDNTIIAYLGKDFEPLYDRYDQMMFISRNTTIRTKESTFFVSERYS